MSQHKKRKKSRGGASGSSKLSRSKNSRQQKKTKARDRILALLIACGIWTLVFIGWRYYSAAQFEKRQEATRVFQTQTLLKQIDIALAAYAENSGGGYPRSTTPELGGTILFEKLAQPRSNDQPPYLPVWAGQLAKLLTTDSTKTTLVDDWGNPINYQSPGEDGAKYRLWSTGGDPENGHSLWITIPTTR